MRLRREIRALDEPRTVPVHKTGLWAGALREITRLDAEVARLRALLREADIDAGYDERANETTVIG